MHPSIDSPKTGTHTRATTQASLHPSEPPASAIGPWEDPPPRSTSWSWVRPRNV